MLTVVHCANPFLPLTTVWMYDQIRTLKRHRPVVLTQMRQNAELFPFDPVYSAEDLPLFEREMYRVVRKLRGTYAGYGKWIREAEGSLIHAHFGQEGYRCLAAKKETQLPMVTTFYGMDVSVLPRQTVWQKRFERLFAEGELFLAEGSFMAESLAHIGCPTDRICVQHLGVDLAQIPFCPPSQKDGDSQVVLTYAAFREKKGLVYALRAFARIANKYPKAQLRMIGDGPLRGEIENEIQRLGLTDRVKILGYLSHTSALAELRDATVLLYPSVTASDGDTEGGAPVALIEAQACGTHVVSTFHADIPEILPHEKCGLLFPERDDAGLAEGLDAFLNNADLRERMAREARKHVEAEHNLCMQSEKLSRIYDGL